MVEMAELEFGESGWAKCERISEALMQVLVFVEVLGNIGCCSIWSLVAYDSWMLVDARRITLGCVATGKNRSMLGQYKPLQR